MMSRLRSPALGSNRTIGSGSVGATFQLAPKFGLGRSGVIEKASLISLTSEDRRTRPHMTGYMVVTPAQAKRHIPGMTLDLTDDEARAHAAQLRHALEYDPYPFAPWLDPLKATSPSSNRRPRSPNLCRR
jgi:hypothetical protein